MKYLTLLPLVFFIGGAAFAEDQKDEEKTAVAERQARKKLVEDALRETGAERNARKDREVAVALDAYNEEVDAELDKVICKKERVTGSRTKKLVCRTVRDIDNEDAATKRMLRRRNRSSQGPAQPIPGVGQ